MGVEAELWCGLGSGQGLDMYSNSYKINRLTAMRCMPSTTPMITVWLWP